MTTQYTAKLDPDTGLPEIMYDGKVVARSCYDDFATYTTGDAILVVFGDFWAGKIPQDKIGVLLKLEVYNGQ